jgi:hypothetical protein
MRWSVYRPLKKFATKQEALCFLEEEVARARQWFIDTGEWPDMGLALARDSHAVKKDDTLAGSLSAYYIDELL